MNILIYEKDPPQFNSNAVTFISFLTAPPFCGGIFHNEAPFMVTNILYIFFMDQLFN